MTEQDIIKLRDWMRVEPDLFVRCIGCGNHYIISHVEPEYFICEGCKN